ncbi:MAG: rhodanese-like domain-containing protein [Pseudomonadota bacterium]
MLALAVGSAAIAQQGQRLSSEAAHTQAARGGLVIVDIRAPSEWRRSGVAQGAKLISMYQPRSAFTAKIKALQASGKRVALICAGGVRSKRMQRALQATGVTGVIDVTDGMLGGRYGRGWIRAGLPTRTFTPK